MRKLMLGKMMVVLTTCLIGTVAMASSITANRGIRNTNHDFAKQFGYAATGAYNSGPGLTTGNGQANGPASTTGNIRVSGKDEICVFCHTPHHGDNTNAPLWNHAITTTGYTPYSSIEETTTGGKSGINNAGNQPSGISQLCLGCHDGTIAIDSFGGKTGTTHFSNIIKIGSTTGSSQLGKVITSPKRDGTGSLDLSNTHPISFDYATAYARIGQGVSTNGMDGTAAVVTDNDGSGGLNSVNSAIISTVGDHSLPGTVQDLLVDGKVECISCHDVHNTQGINGLLKVNNYRSGLCLTCHNK